MNKNFITVKILATLIVSLLVAFNSLAHFGTKGPYGGTITTAFVYDSTVYLGTENGGVFSSTTSKLVGWKPIPVGLKQGKITAITHTGKYLFSATTDSGVFVYTGFVGSDRYWIKVNKGLSNLNVTSLLAVDSITVLAGTNGGGVFKFTYDSKNKTGVWSEVNNPILHHKEITALVKAGNRFINIAVDGGVYATDDLGATWIDFNDTNTDEITTTAASYNTASDELLIVNTGGLYIATKASTTTAPTYTKVDGTLPAGIVIRSISNNGTTWFLATDKGVYQSPVATISWTAINTGLTTDDVNVALSFKNLLLAGTAKEGVFTAPATFTSWTAKNVGLNNLRTFAVTTTGTSTGIAIAVVATERGVFVTKDFMTAANYVRSNKGLTDSLNVNDILFADFCILAATKNEGVFFSADTGKTWTTANTGIVEKDIKRVFYSNMTKYAIAANGNVYSAPLHSFTWTAIQTGLPSGVVPTSLAFYSGKLLLGTLGNGVYVKPVSGGTWTAANTNLSNLNVTSVAVKGQTLFAGTDGSGVFTSDSTTASISWTPTAPLSISHTRMIGLDSTKVQALAVNDAYVFASYQGGLLATSDNGKTWIAGGNQFNLPSYADVFRIGFITGATGRVVVSTPYNSVYSNGLSELPVVAGLTDEMEAAQKAGFVLFPNPSYGQFAFKAEAEISTITIYNSVGKVMDVISGANTSVSVNYPQGIYFVRAASSKGMLTQKLTIE